MKAKKTAIKNPVSKPPRKIQANKLVHTEVVGDLDWLGGYNEAPPNWREIDEKEFSQRTLYDSCSPEFIVFRQIMDKKKPCISAHLLVYWDNSGVSIVSDYWGKDGKFVHFYSFAKCSHDWKSVSIGHCLRRETCTKCGISHEVDSSD
jgi:hypothetical protein